MKMWRNLEAALWGDVLAPCPNSHQTRRDQLEKHVGNIENAGHGRHMGLICRNP